MTTASEMLLFAALADASVARAVSQLPLSGVRLGTVNTSALAGGTVSVTLDGDTTTLPIQVTDDGWYPAGTRVAVLLVPPAGALVLGAVNGGYDPWHPFPAATNGWVYYGFGNAVAGYRREGDRVWLRGVIAGGALNAVAFTLPDGYRPPTNVPAVCASNNGVGYLSILTSGTVSPIAGSAVWFSLEGVSFSLVA